MKFLDFIRHVKPHYKPDWYHLRLIEMLERSVMEGMDLLCSGPPGCGKTEIFGILFPAWLIEEDTHTHIIELANSDSLAKLASSNVLRLVRSAAFQELCPLVLDKETEGQFQVEGNDGRPTLHAAGINGSVTGHRAKFLCYDDLTKSLADAYSQTVREKTWAAFNSVAETRLLPDGHIYGIQTRWALDDTHGRLLRRALESPDARQFLYLNLSATNNGDQAYVLDTRSNTREYLPAYKSLATVLGQPYSFSPKQLRGKLADLGPIIYSALYQGNPVNEEAQMFPPDVWGTVERFNRDEYSMVVTAWDTASRSKATNDPSANVIIGRRWTGDFVVLDAAEFRLTLDKLFPVILERYRLLCERFDWALVPVLCVEDASSGQQVIDLLKAGYSNIPLVEAKAVHSKIIRAEGCTPITTARSVSLLRDSWNATFIADMSNFPASDRDHYTDSFVHGLKSFVGSGRDFHEPEFELLPGRVADEMNEQLEELEFQNETSFCSDLDDVEKLRRRM